MSASPEAGGRPAWGPPGYLLQCAAAALADGCVAEEQDSEPWPPSAPTTGSFTGPATTASGSLASCAASPARSCWGPPARATGALPPASAAADGAASGAGLSCVSNLLQGAVYDDAWGLGGFACLGPSRTGPGAPPAWGPCAAPQGSPGAARLSSGPAGAGGRIAELSLEERLAGSPGPGGCAVYKGRWNYAPAAVKVAYACGPHQDVGRVVEMAVLSSVRHPNVLALYELYTDCAQDGAPQGPAPVAMAAGGNGNGNGGGGASVRSVASDAGRGGAPGGFRRLWPGEAEAERAAWGEGPAVCDLIVTEFCDLGSLSSALGAGALPGPWGRAGGAAAAEAARCVLLDIAAALCCLHGSGLVHGNVSAHSVLLKSDPSRAAGLVAKLSGFSRCQLYSAEGAALGVTVLPEAPGAEEGRVVISPLAGGGGDAGGAATPADDVRGFGALAWQVFASACTATGTPRRVPPLLGALAAACCAPEGPARPTISEVARALERMDLGAAADRP